MATTTCLTNNFRKGLFSAVYDFDAGIETYMMALYVNETHDQNTGAYIVTNEVATAGGYTALGIDIGDLTIATDTSAHVSYLDSATNPSWATSTITSTACMIYRSGGTVPVANPTVYLGDFSGSKSSSSGTFTVVYPTPAAATAVIRLA